MKTDEIILVVVMAVLLVIMCAYYSKSNSGFGKRVLHLLFGALSGMALLYPAHLILGWLGYGLSVNLFTLLVSGILGIPGVLLLTAAVLL